ncbi:glutathione S-transferase [Litoreibacter ponti]|uniref:glutathione transferase n=1 Tax=Litoreibacter ponti TaxID=1510457 RepID=A0A2T6BP54_9RHOB|nr:glutathione S-transferase [Litoreibacter ponti]PTX57860.1 glutathione S-transferase [Litoreibacter ponti]
MRLYSSPTSPYVRKVHLVLRETGQLDDVEMVGAIGTPLDSSKMPTEHNPLGKIPALVLDDGSALFDSRVICRYFDDRASAGLYGSGETTWTLQTLEAAADGILDAALLMVYEARVRPEDKQFAEWVEGQWGKISAALNMLEGRAMNSLSSDKINIAQISVACALSYLDFRHGDRAWQTGREKLAAWHAEFSERASMQATVPVG